VATLAALPEEEEEEEEEETDCRDTCAFSTPRSETFCTVPETEKVGVSDPPESHPLQTRAQRANVKRGKRFTAGVKREKRFIGREKLGEQGLAF
jgi:hypothetical protein